MAELLQVRNCANPKRRGDVIFVHGLNGNPREYWFPAGQPEKYWLAWLGEDLPDVGVWSLGYENAALKPRGFSLARRFLQAGFSMPLEDRADNVLLRLELEGIGERPLVFIGHSMGGLLIKEVLRTANESRDAKRRAIVERTRGVCFIATPHNGSDLAKLAHYFGSLLGINVSVEELRPHQPHLRKLNQWYRDFVTREGNSIKTLSFFEMKPLPRVGLVVEAGDADPGVPHAGLHPLDEDHDSICKPPSKLSSIYQRTLEFIDVDCLGSLPGSTGAGSETPDEDEGRTLMAPRAFHRSVGSDVMPRVSQPEFDPSPQGRARAPMDRDVLVATLERLAPADFQSLVTRIPRAASQVSRQGTVLEHVAELIRWAEGPTGPGLAVVEEAFEKLRNP
jgi:pimeloyl-ACP methyl ester carboxylesterase